MLRKLLPYLLVKLTGHSRYLPDIEWSGNSWTHNAFRLYELIFWRRVGVRVESGAWATKDQNGRETHSHTFYTFEAMLAFAESWVRGRFPRVSHVRVYVPVLGFAGMPQQAPLSFKLPYLLAVAYDIEAHASGTVGTSNSVSLTCSGSDRMLIGGTATRGTNSTFTYNGVALTARSAATNTDTAKAFSMASPPTGANTLAATFSATNYSFGGINLTGASSTLGTDATATGSTSTPSVVATSVSGGMVVDIMVHGDATTPTATGANTRRWFVGAGSLDTGGMSTAPGAASVTMSWSVASASIWAQVAVPVAPIAVAATGDNFLMGANF